jgi:Tol biopolymer transport system component/imidazolonepropionase-like amidohydrolase
VDRIHTVIEIVAASALVSTVWRGSTAIAIDDRRPARASSAPIDVTVGEGTSMAVAVSPDGRTLAIDLQGSIWTLPSAGGAATRLTDLFSDARQPTWSPDGAWITFFAYRDGGYHLWSISPDGTRLRQLTNGPFDDREPMWSHDGSRIAFSSDRGSPLGSDYNLWVLDIRSGRLRQLTNNPAEDYMPSWSPDDKEIAFASTRQGGQSVWAVAVEDGTERKLATARGRVDAPSWGPAGVVVYHALGTDSSGLERDGTSLTSGENAFPFRVSWASPTEFYYVSDGRIRKRALGGSRQQEVPFTATLQVTRPSYVHRKRDFDSPGTRRAVGIVRPVISPDGTKVAFAALGDIYVMPVGGKPQNVTADSALDTDPAWSPDGTRLVYSSDRGGEQLQLWIRDMRSGQSRQVTHMTTQPQGATWSPDGKRIAFFNVTGMWRVAEISVLDVEAGTVTRLHDTLPQPGTPTWSADGLRLAFANVAPYSTRFREGTNQVLTISATASGNDKWFAPAPTLSIDSRGGCGPVWSPDGTMMAAIYEGILTVWPVSAAGEPLGPPRRVTTESANSPSWQGDSRHILYLNDDKLKIVDIGTGELRTVPLELAYALDVPKSRLVVHAGRLIDMKSPAVRSNVDIVIDGNRIRSIEPHNPAAHARGRVVDASNLTVMPGLIEFHSHLQPDFGEAQGRAWLAFGITTVRSPGGIPYEAVEEREASEAGVRAGPRVYSTGHLMEYRRVYYKMGIALSSPAHLELELQRAKALRYDLLKSYVRLPDLQQKRTVEFAHGIGVPVATHEIYPAAYVGVDNTEHTAATSRRGYSPKQATLQRAYEDVTQLFGRSARTLCPMISAVGASKLFADEPALKADPRFNLYPAWIRRQVADRRPVVATTPGGAGRMVIDAMRAGALIVAGTDSPNAINLHGEITTYVLAGMTPYEALKAATANPAQALGLDAGTLEVGKLADLVIVEGNPLEDIANAHKVRRVVANGRLYELDELLNGGRAALKAPTTR